MTKGPLAGLASGRCLVMGVVNVTPDSFSDGGEHATAEAAIEHGLALAAAGADLVDIGGESTRPGAGRVRPAVEADRVLPVVAALTAAGVRVSIDTTRASVAHAALAAGAVLVNDVSGGLADPGMLEAVAAWSCAYAVMHSRGDSRDMTTRTDYPDGALAGVTAELAERVDAVVAAGVDPDRLVIDPGLGFAKNASQNWELLRGLPALRALGYPVLVGASRKSFLGQLLADPGGTPRDVSDRDDATQAVTTLAAAAGAWCVRVHDVRPAADAVRVVHAWCAAG